MPQSITDFKKKVAFELSLERWEQSLQTGSCSGRSPPSEQDANTGRGHKMSKDREGENKSGVTQDRELAGNLCIWEPTPTSLS